MYREGDYELVNQLYGLELYEKYTREDVNNIFIAKNVQQYIVNLVTMTRQNEDIYLGVSPRGSIALMKASKALAYIQGREYVLPDDVKYLAPFVLSHRLILTPEAKYNGQTNEGIINYIIKSVNIPIREEHI